MQGSSPTIRQATIDTPTAGAARWDCHPGAGPDETITGLDEGIASEMPAEREERRPSAPGGNAVSRRPRPRPAAGPRNAVSLSIELDRDWCASKCGGMAIPAADFWTPWFPVGGILISLAGFLLGLKKWRQEQPRIVATVEAIESFHSDCDFESIHFVLRNTGGKQTTVEKITLIEPAPWFADGKWGLMMRLVRCGVTEYNIGSQLRGSKALPYVLEPNGVYKCHFQIADEPEAGVRFNRLLLSNLDEQITKGRLRYAIVCAHHKRPKGGRVKVEKSSIDY